MFIVTVSSTTNFITNGNGLTIQLVTHSLLKKKLAKCIIYITAKHLLIGAIKQLSLPNWLIKKTMDQLFSNYGWYVLKFQARVWWYFRPGVLNDRLTGTYSESMESDLNTTPHNRGRNFRYSIIIDGACPIRFNQENVSWQHWLRHFKKKLQ